MMDFEIARKNMVESQVQTCDVTDKRILQAMRTVPREAFLPASRRDIAYMDGDIPITGGEDLAAIRYLSEPMIFAKLVQLCAIEAEDLILEIGTGTGYGAAILAALGDSVVALESDPDLATQATENLMSHDIANVAVVEGALDQGLAKQGPYDVILLQGAVPQVPKSLLAQLKQGGRLVAVIGQAKGLGQGQGGKAAIFLRDDDVFTRRNAFDALLPPLPGFEIAEKFVF